MFGSITDQFYTVKIGEIIIVSANFTDTGRLDTQTASWEWGDGPTSVGPVNETNGLGSVNGSHSYASAGVYIIPLIVTDDDGDSGTAIYQYVVTYDPDGGFVTGGGWIWSQAGWCQLNALCGSTEGKAHFGFVSRYRNGASIPTGNTEFNFSLGNFNFRSSEYQWLIVNQGGTNAQFKGTGTINGGLAPNGAVYHFMIWAKDLNPGSNDTFRIKIWYETSNGGQIVVYDNGFNQAISGGSIQIHRN